MDFLTFWQDADLLVNGLRSLNAQLLEQLPRGMAALEQQWRRVQLGAAGAAQQAVGAEDVVSRQVGCIRSVQSDPWAWARRHAGSKTTLHGGMRDLRARPVPSQPLHCMLRKIMAAQVVVCVRAGTRAGAAGRGCAAPAAGLAEPRGAR